MPSGGRVEQPLDGWDMFAEVRRLDCPALLVHGGARPSLEHLPQRIRELNDALLRGIERELGALAAEAGRVRAARIDSAAHMLHLDEPELTAGLIREFVRSGS